MRGATTWFKPVPWVTLVQAFSRNTMRCLNEQLSLKYDESSTAGIPNVLISRKKCWQQKAGLLQAAHLAYCHINCTPLRFVGLRWNYFLALFAWVNSGHKWVPPFLQTSDPTFLLLWLILILLMMPVLLVLRNIVVQLLRLKLEFEPFSFKILSL